MTKPKRIFLFFPLLLFILCLLFPTVCANGVQKGLSLSLESALPALFPALVLSKILVSLLGNSSSKGSLLAILFLGLFCGFPIGAMGIASFYEMGAIRKKEAERLLFFSSQAGPAFLIGFCGTGIFGSAKIGWLLFFLQLALALFFLFCFFGKSLFQKDEKQAHPAFSPPILHVIPAALSEAAHSFLSIASCIIFFSFFGELIFHLFPFSEEKKALVSLFLELTSGCKALSSLPRKKALFYLAAGCGWNGLSVHLQVLSCLSQFSLSAKNYFLGKLVFTVLMPLLMLFFQKLLS